MLNWFQKKIFYIRKSFLLLFFLVFVSIFTQPLASHPLVAFGYGGNSTPVSREVISSSSDASITKFTFPNQVLETSIDNKKFTIHITMPYNTDVSALRPEIVFVGKSIAPASSELVDFSRARTYTISAEDASQKIYTVYVSLSPSAEILEPQSKWFVEVVTRTDFVRDGIIDILDFNALMVHWSDDVKKNTTDANKDSFVDLFDFNLLMIHWGKEEF